MDQVCHWIQEHYDIPSGSVTVQHFQPEDFLITFSFYDDMLHVLHNPLPQDASFVLVFKSWTCQLRATAMKLFYHVIIRLRGIPANARHLSTARQILSPRCSKVQLANSAKDDVRSLTVHAWCVHPDLIPKAKIMHILEPEEVFVRGPPLFLNPEETIFQNHPTLHYRVEIDILKVEDWHDTSNSSSSDDDGFPPPLPLTSRKGFALVILFFGNGQREPASPMPREVAAMSAPRLQTRGTQIIQHRLKMFSSVIFSFKYLW
jgi:hypothetical protein